MTVRKMTTLVSLDELGLTPSALECIRWSGITVKELIDTARICEIEGGTNRFTVQFNIPRQYAAEIVRAVDEAGFILHESKRSRCARRLLVAIFDSCFDRELDFLSEYYEDLEEMSPEAFYALDDLLHEALDDRRVLALQLRFGLNDGQPRTQKECAHELSVSPGRIRQLVNVAEARLRHPSHSFKLKAIICYSQEMIERRAFEYRSEIRALEEELDRRTLELKTEIWKLQRDLDALQELIHGSPANILIEDLNLSYRTYRCLKRSGINTVGQLCGTRRVDLLDIRNFGAKSLDEVEQKLQEFGLKLVS